MSSETAPTAKPVKTTGLHVGDAAPGVKKVDPIVVADGVTRTFGGLTAVDVEHLEIPRGAITALIGPNGAGKTTFFNLLTGFDKPDTGTWSFDGKPLARHARVQGGPHGPGPHLPAHQVPRRCSPSGEHEARREGADGREPLPRPHPGDLAQAGRARSRRRRWSCSPASSSTPRRTTTRRASPAASASCSRWRGRS